MKLLAMLLLYAVLTGCAVSRGTPPVCGDQGTLPPHAKQTSTSLALKPRSDQPMLYLVSDHYAILMPAPAVTDLLRSKSPDRMFHAAPPELLAYIEADLPLEHDTDLRRYSIRDTRVELSLPYLAAELLETETASVIDLWQLSEDKNIRSATLVRVDGMGVWRDFCDTSGRYILSVTDLIVN